MLGDHWRYSGRMTDDEGQIGAVTEEDVRALLATLKPGGVYPSAELWGRYTRAMEAAGRPWGNRNQLGRRLTALGCEKHRSRRMVRGQQTETSAWIIPGAPPRDEEAQRILATIADLGGDGIYPVDEVWDRYQALARRHGWTWTLNESGLARRLTKMGYPKPFTENHRKVRYLFVPKR